MIEWLKNKQEYISKSSKVIFFRETGTKPFKDVDFTKYNVFSDK